MILTYYTATTLIIIAYLLGSIPSAVWIGKKYYGIDIREHGSKNAGTTNMLRVLGKRAALPDDVPEEVKSARLAEIIALQNELSRASNLRDVGREFEVLVEGTSKRDENQLSGRTSQNKVVVFDRGGHGVGDYVRVRITGCTPATLFGEEISEG